MRLGRESFILIAVPVLLLAGAWYLLIPAREHDRGAVRPPVARHVADFSDVSLGGDPPRPRDDRGTDDVGNPNPLRAVADPAARHDGAVGPPKPGEPVKGYVPSRSPGSSRPGSRDQERTPGESRPRRSPFRGRLVDSNGRPIDDGVIVVSERSNNFDLRGRSAHEEALPFNIPILADGSFEIPRRSGYVYTIQVAAPGYASTSSNLYTASSTLVTLLRPATIEGTVTDRVTDLPVTDAKVTLHTVAGSVARYTDAQGGYEFHGVTPGSAWLEIVHPNFAIQYRQFTDQELVANAELFANFQLVGGLRLEGQVVLENTMQAPAELVSVRVFDRFRLLYIAEVFTTESGTFAVNALNPNTAYRIRVISQSYGESVLEMSTPAQGDPQPVVIELANPWTLAGRVTDSTGVPLHGVHVTVTGVGGDNETSPNAVLTNELGEFTASGLGSAEYSIRTFHEDYVVENVTGITRATNAGETLQISLQRGSLIVGTVANPSGTGIAGAAIRVEVRDPGTEQLVTTPFFAFSAESGEFCITQVPVGSVSLKFIANGYHTKLDRFLLPTEGATVERSIRLEPKSSSER